MGSAAAAVFLTAFEVRYPVLRAGPVSFTITELAAVVFMMSLLAWGLGRSRERLPEPGHLFSRRNLDAAVLIFLASNFLSTAFSADIPGALKFSLRMTLAAMMYFGISRLPQRRPAHLLVAGSLAAALFVVTLVGLLENFLPMIDWPRWLSPWQESIVTFGTFYNLRVSSTLPFPTVLSMYLELAAPLALMLGVIALERGGISGSRKRWLRTGLVVALTAVMAVLVFTYTRSALVAAPVSMLAGSLMALRCGYGRRAAGFLALGVALLGLLLAGTTAVGDKMANRLGLSEQVKHYGADYTILKIPESMRPGERYTASLRIKNTSEVSWKSEGSDKITFSYRWLAYPDKSDYEIEHLVTYLPREIFPGEELDLEAEFLTPADPGRYVLAMELVKAHVGWFSDDAGAPPLTVPVEIATGGGMGFAIEEEKESFVQAKPILVTPSRSILWRAAVNMWQEHPVLGVGPGQYRKVYHEYVSGVESNDRLETHNIFLEALANTGLLGLAAMLYLLGATASAQLRLVRDRSLARDRRLIALGLMVALIAYVTHGLLDFFLWQTGITFIFFAQLGLTAWLSHTSPQGGCVPQRIQR